jgi:hypothetical protein
MSLDVYLKATEPFPSESSSGIFIRENGRQFEISREEWDRRNPGREPAISIPSKETSVLYTDNITHNLTPMASEARLYRPLWRPEEIGITKASGLIGPLTGGLGRLRADPERYKRFNPPSGWGSYEVFVEFVTNYLAACQAHPEAAVEVWR